MSEVTAQQLGEVLDRLRSKQPLVHCMTNEVVTNFTANVLLAIGASPAMVQEETEVKVFAPIADALLINLGTVSQVTTAAMRTAILAGTAAGTPWVLDPVAVGVLPLRTQFAQDVLALKPNIIRANASELISLAGGQGGARGVDTSASVDAAQTAASALSAHTGKTVAVSGPVDLVVSRDRQTRVRNGDVMMTRVTGVGCALGALMAACSAVETDTHLAAVAATAIMTVAADGAVQCSTGPGAFAVQLIDALGTLSAADLVSRVQL